MPPQSTRTSSPTTRTERPPDHPHDPYSPSYLTALRGLENPVSSSILNIADTLTTSLFPEDETSDENVRFLRLPIDPQEEWRAENAREESSRERQRTVLEHRAEERERRERMVQVMSRLDRLRRVTESSTYGEIVPSHNNLYDWSPHTIQNTDDEELNELMDELRNQPNITTMNPEILRAMSRSQLESERQSQGRHHTSRFLHSTQPTSESSLRAMAIVQSVRRHPRFSERSRNYLQRYAEERGNTSRSAVDAHPPPRDPASPRSPIPGTREPSRYEQNRRTWLAEQQQPTSEPRGFTRDSHRDSYRRHFLEDPPSMETAPPRQSKLERIIEFYSRLRERDTDASYDVAFGTGVATEPHNDREGYLQSIGSIPLPEPSSWLQPGAILTGVQHATTASSTIQHLPPAPPAAQQVHEATGLPTPSNANQGSIFGWGNHLTVGAGGPRPRPRSSDAIPPHARRATDTSPTTPTPSHQDRWPVKVHIHDVDYTNMTLSATMEAYNVPSQPSSVTSILNPSGPSTTRTSSITTFLEGEILDFRNTTFLTEKFASSASNDATYWRKLEPFAQFGDEDLARHWPRAHWMAKVAQEYIFMRWKERCFVKPIPPSSSSSEPTPVPPTLDARFPPSSSSSSSSAPQHPCPTTSAAAAASSGTAADESCGLTISGFYYVSLKRSDGAVQGLYFDPSSSPYQCLRLVSSVKGGLRPTWEFR